MDMSYIYMCFLITFEKNFIHKESQTDFKICYYI